jgi:hypothetical protein
VNASLKPSQIVLLASGAVTFLFSFFAFFKAEGFNGDETFNAWSGDAGTMFMATWPALFGLVIAGAVAAAAFGNVSLPDRLLTFSIQQWYFILALVGAVIMVGYLLGGGVPDFGGTGPDKGFGFWLMLLGSLGLVAGSVMELLDLGPSSTGSNTGANQPPSPF